MTERYKVCVCGSRTWRAVTPIQDRLKELHRTSGGVTELLVGDAKGADTLASLVGRHLRITQTVYTANWRGEGRSAGMRRNLRMLNDSPDLVLAFWDGKSSGTRFMIQEAKKRGIPLEVWTFGASGVSVEVFPGGPKPAPLFPYDTTIR